MFLTTFFGLQAQPSAPELASVESMNVNNLITFSFTKGGNLLNLLESKHNDLSEKLLEIEKVPLEASEYISLIKNGAYIATGDSHLYINKNYDYKFTRAELLEKSTNKQVFKINLGDPSEFVDLNDIESGVYVLILTNDEGDIDVEELNIVRPE